MKECRDIDPEWFHDQQIKNAYFIPNVCYKAPKKVDPLRLSQSISKNMMKDINKDAYAKEEPVPTDMNLANRDQEIIFGADNDDAAEPAIKNDSKPYNEQKVEEEKVNEIVDVKDISSHHNKTASILGDRANLGKMPAQKRVNNDHLIDKDGAANDIRKDDKTT